MLTLTYRGLKIDILRVQYGVRKQYDSNPNKCVDIADIHVFGMVKNLTDEQLKKAQSNLMKPWGSISFKVDGKEVISKNLSDGCAFPSRAVLRRMGTETIIVDFDVQMRDD